MAGVSAALAAARHGTRVVLVHDRSVLGGNASSEIRMHIVGASCSGRRPGARESGIIDELRVEDAVQNPQRSAALFDLLLYDKIRREPNILLLLDTDCTGCVVEQHGDRRRIVQLKAVRTSTEEEFLIQADWFADCTGDGRLGSEAGAEFRVGREGSQEFGESLAPETADRCTLGSTILFTAREHSRPMPYAAPPWARRFREDDLRLRSHREYEYGYWWAEYGGTLDAIADADRIRHELLAIALGVWDHVKNGCSRAGDSAAVSHDKWRDSRGGPEPGSARNWALEWVGMIPGKRESRRFLGPRILTQKDILEGRTWDDQVAYGGWWIDLHPPAGIDAASEFPCEQVDVPHLYGIPLGSLYSRNVENLFFAGRNISATHVAFASTRVMATCSVMGQAEGTAAAVGSATGARRAGELASGERIFRIQQTLLRDDAFLLAVGNQDPEDVARTAQVTASSEQSGSPAAAVLSGISRKTTPALHQSLEDRSHQWASTGVPAWIELRWPVPQAVSQIELTFDTGFERELTLTASDAYNRRMIRGPQPETVKDYRIEWPGGSVCVSGNYLRKRIHRLEAPATTDRIRVSVETTHGDAAARIFEIRAYS